MLGEQGGKSEGVSMQRAALLLGSPCLSSVWSQRPAPPFSAYSPSLGPSGPQCPGEDWPLLKDVLPGEDSEDELRLLPGLRCAGHNHVHPRLQPQFLAHFLLCEKRRRVTQGSIFPEELRGQFLLGIKAL